MYNIYVEEKKQRQTNYFTHEIQKLKKYKEKYESNF